MKNICLGEIASFVKGDTTKACNIDPKKYISTENMLPNIGGISIAGSTPPASNSSVKLFRAGDILISNIRPYLKKIWLATFDGACSTDVLILRANEKCTNEYLYYNLTLDDFFEYATLTAKGTRMPRCDVDSILNYQIRFINNKEQQQALVVPLVNIDNQIKLNCQINDNLEAMAKQLYDYWFVQFDFPDENGRPYKSSGGKMVWSKELNREIPAEWETGVLENISDIYMGQSPSGESYNSFGYGITFYQGCADFGEIYPIPKKYTTAPIKLAYTDDILMSVRAPVGEVNIANNDCCIGRGLCALRSKDGNYPYLYCLVKELSYILGKRHSLGTTFGAINKLELCQIPIVLPSSRENFNFNKQCKPIFEQLKIIDNEIYNLMSLRSFILSKLLNGQMTVAARGF